MGRKLKLVLLVIITLIAAMTIVWIINQDDIKEREFSAEETTAIAKAKEVYRRNKTYGDDLSLGRCLNNDLMPGWVADIAHSPRKFEDNLPHNQCVAYLEGRATHIVELDSQGNVIRVE